MGTIDLADAKVHLSELLDRVKAEGPLEITLRGKPVVQLSGTVRVRTPIDRAVLEALTTIMPAQAQNAAGLVRSMRDGDRF